MATVAKHDPRSYRYRLDEGLKRLQRAIGRGNGVAVERNRQNLLEFLVKSELVSEGVARVVAMTSPVTGQSAIEVLSSSAVLSIDKLASAVETCDVASLVAGIDLNVRLPRDLLRNLKIVPHVQTAEKLVISTLSSEQIVQQALAPYIGNRKIIVIPFSFEKWAEFEPMIDRVIEPDTVIYGGDSYYQPRPIIPTDTDDSEVLDRLLDLAAEIGASDIHIEPTRAAYNVFFRILGVRQLVYVGSLEQYGAVCAMVKDRSRLDPMDIKRPQDGSFNRQIRGRSYDIRVATIPTDGREKIVMRLLDPIKAQMRLTQLGISRVDVWRHIVNHRNGIVLIVGSTGSGKTTTLNATLRELPLLDKAVYTVEDPVEYTVPLVTHTQVLRSVGYDFARATKAFMRGDPDIIVIGEIRDLETATQAIQAAETGHLVIATVHAESIQMSLKRLSSLGVKISEIDSLLRGVLVQFLVRTLCPSCRGSGCATCHGVGYAGRTVVSEIASFSSVSEVQAAFAGEAFWDPLWKDLERKIEAGVTDGREIYRCFTSEMVHFAKHSPVLARVLHEQQMLRGMVEAKASGSLIESLPEADRIKARQIAMTNLLARTGLSSNVEDIVSNVAAECDAAYEAGRSVLEVETMRRDILMRLVSSGVISIEVAEKEIALNARKRGYILSSSDDALVPIGDAVPASEAYFLRGNKAEASLANEELVHARTHGRRSGASLRKDAARTRRGSSEGSNDSDTTAGHEPGMMDKGD